MVIKASNLHRSDCHKTHSPSHRGQPLNVHRSDEGVLKYSMPIVDAELPADFGGDDDGAALQAISAAI